MHIEISHQTNLYSMFFSLAHIVSWCILFWFGYKHKYPLFQWMLIIATGFISFTIGTHLLALDIENIKVLIHSGTLPVSGGKSLISGLLLAVPSMLFIKYLLKFKYDIFKPYAFVIPLGIAIQRIGCFAAGCCYGKVTYLPWGVTYAHGFSAHINQWKEGSIAVSDLTALAVHPVQLYESFLCIVACILIIVISKKSWFRGPLIYVSLLFYSIIRFAMEFYRANQAHTIGINQFWGLNTVQWILLVAMLISIYILLTSNKKTIENESNFSSNTHFYLKDYLWYLSLFMLILLTPGFYSALERLLLGIIFIPLSALVFWEFFKLITIPKLRFASVSLCVMGIFLMSQNSPVVEKSLDEKGNKYHEISIGGYAGTNNMTHYSEDCDGNKYEDYRFKEKYYMMGVGYQYVNEISNDEKLTLGIGAGFGKLKEHVENANNNYANDLDYNYEQNIFSFSPYVKYDLHRIGFGFGLQAGDISIFRGEYRSFTAFKRYSVLPQVHFRVGNLDKAWGEFNYGFEFPSISPANEYELLVGIRGGNGNTVRFGTSAFHAIVIRPEFYIDNKIGIGPYVGLFGPMFSSSYVDRLGIEGGLSLHYRIQN